MAWKQVDSSSQVRRNIDRFPEDFMFEMKKEDLENWRSQFGISNKDKIGLRYAPFCFTEQGVAMLSSVLNSKTAIEVNIRIISVFTRMREMLFTHKDILLKRSDLSVKKKIGATGKLQSRLPAGTRASGYEFIAILYF